MTRLFDKITLTHLQDTQPWRVPYSPRFLDAKENGGLPHLMGTHAVLHAQKTVGQLAAVFESFDHSGRQVLDDSQREMLEGRCADLVTAAMRLANLYGFDLARRVVERSEEKNGVILRWPGDEPKGGFAPASPGTWTPPGEVEEDLDTRI